jgi:general secretion pathway protein I
MMRHHVLSALHGFSLLEVMVAVAILAMSFTAIFASEVGAFKVAHRTRQTGVAVVLARCKMGELEEKVGREGLPAVLYEVSDNCCKDGDRKGFRCMSKIERIVLPGMTDDKTTDNGDKPDEEDLDRTLQQARGATGSAPTLGKPNTPVGLSGAGVSDAGVSDAGVSDAGVSSDSYLRQGGGSDMIGQLAMQYVYPVIKPSFEEYVRRATVAVLWKEGSKEHSMRVVQYLVADLPPGALPASLPTGPTTGQVPGAPAGGAGGSNPAGGAGGSNPVGARK